MKRRDFLKRGLALGSGALLARNAPGSPVREPGAGIPMGRMILPENPGFETRHLVVIIYGNGARTKDVLGNPDLAPCQRAMASEATVFTEDYGETVNLHGHMVTELLQGVSPSGSRSQRPQFPTWNEYVRKKTAGKATDFFVLQGVSTYRAWGYDIKHYSHHPDYGPAYGATSLTMNKMFFPQGVKSPREIVGLNVEAGLGISIRDRRALEDLVAGVLARKSFVPPSTTVSCAERVVQLGDAQVLTLAPEILKSFRPKILTLQILGLDEAHRDFGHWHEDTGYAEYARHIRVTDELIGRLWSEIQNDPGLASKTALIIRPDCGRDDEVDGYGQLGHSPGNRDAHYVWTMALGPDFRKGVAINDPVSRRDLAPTITYLMSGESAEHATGHVRTGMFREHFRLPDYAPPVMAGIPAPVGSPPTATAAG